MHKNEGDKNQDLLSEIGEVIRNYRKEKKVPQAKLADLSGIDRHTLSNIENGASNLRFITLHKIVRALHMPADFLFYPEIRSDLTTRQKILMELNDCSENELGQLLRAIKYQKDIMREEDNP